MRQSGRVPQPFDRFRQFSRRVESYQEKWPQAKFIAYFQSYTNTYESVEMLKRLFEEAISFPGVVGLA
ncbi:MAG: hypothetical protein MI976_04885, partial [Pseudomonadales bacterium]|nr:hypothetical protein [Pseudomonadales bacterium]